MKQARMKKTKVFMATLSLAVLSLLCLQGCGAKKEAVSEEEEWIEEIEDWEESDDWDEWDDWEESDELGEDDWGAEGVEEPEEPLDAPSNDEIFQSLDTSQFDDEKFDGKFIVSYDTVTCLKYKNKESVWYPSGGYYLFQDKTKTGFLQEGVVALTWEELFLPDGLVLSGGSGAVHGNRAKPDTMMWADLGGFLYFELGGTMGNIQERNTYIQNHIGEGALNRPEQCFNVTPEIAEKWGQQDLGVLLEVLGQPSFAEEDEDSYMYYLEWAYEEYTIYAEASKEDWGIDILCVSSNDLLD